MRRIGVEFGTVGVCKPGLVARVFDDGQLHPQAYAEIGDAILARILDRPDLAFDAAFSESTRNQDRVHVLQAIDAVAFNRFRVDVVDVDLAARVNASMSQRFGKRFV